MSFVFDTIAAVSTPRGKGGIAVIRISGAEAAAVLSRVFLPAGKSAPSETPRRACFGRICLPCGEVIDEGLAVFFPAPASFTGEDVAELSCHGGALLTKTVLGAVLAAGARPATAGEFTRRALLHGKMGLSSAEALGALLDAATPGQMALARGGLSGKLAEAIQDIYSKLALLLADSYAKIDFPEEDLGSLTREELTATLTELRRRVQQLSRTYRTGHAVGEGIRTVICGPVNAGKSTLYNALVGREAAIVTDIAGTTRDLLSETVALGAVTLRLCDTAGLRETADAVEQIGVERARRAMDEAELILAVLDASRPIEGEGAALLAELKKSPATVVVILNKTDLAAAEVALPQEFSHVVRLCAATGEVEELRRLVEGLYLSDGIDLKQDAVVANARQYAALSRAEQLLDAALHALSLGVPLDAALVDAELAMGALGEVDGRAVDEEIVDRIFSHFCVGK